MLKGTLDSYSKPATELKADALTDAIPTEKQQLRQKMIQYGADTWQKEGYIPTVRELNKKFKTRYDYGGYFKNINDFHNAVKELVGIDKIITKKQKERTEEKERRKQEIIDCYTSAVKNGYLLDVQELNEKFGMDISNYFTGGMKELKHITGTEDVKLPTKSLQKRREKKAKEIRDYIKRNPNAVHSDVTKSVGDPDLYIPGGINQVRKEQGINPKYGKITPEIREERGKEFVSYAKDYYNRTGCRPTLRKINKHFHTDCPNYIKMDELLQMARITKNAPTENAKKIKERNEANIEKIISSCKQIYQENGYVPTLAQVEKDLGLNVKYYSKCPFKEILSKANISGPTKFKKELIEKKQEESKRIENYIKKNPNARYHDIERLLNLKIRNYFSGGIRSIKKKFGFKPNEIRKRQLAETREIKEYVKENPDARNEMLEHYIQNLGSEEIVVGNIQYYGFKNVSDIRSEALKLIKNSPSLNKFIITPEIFAKALKNYYDGMGEEGANDRASHTLSFFDPSSDRIIDNILESEDRDSFYTLEEDGLLFRPPKDEVFLPDGRPWEIHYWELNKRKILELALSPKKKKIKKKKKDYSIYEGLPEEVWQRDKNA